MFWYAHALAPRTARAPFSIKLIIPLERSSVGNSLPHLDYAVDLTLLSREMTSARLTADIVCSRRTNITKECVRWVLDENSQVQVDPADTKTTEPICDKKTASE